MTAANDSFSNTNQPMNQTFEEDLRQMRQQRLRKMTFAQRAKQPEFSAEDKSHGMVIELNFVKSCTVKLSWEEYIDDKKIILFRQENVTGEAHTFKEFLCNYQDLYQIDDIYIVLEIDNEEFKLRRKSEDLTLR